MFFGKCGFATILVGSLMSMASIVPAVAGQYGALHVTAGVARNFSSPGRAARAANDACLEEGRNCKVVGTFSNGGCGYISVGHNANSTRYGIGATAQRALNNCRIDDFECNPPKGGCTSDDY